MLVEGSPSWGRLDGGSVVLDSGERLDEATAHFLAPVEPTKIIATHLTYRSRVEEYAARTPPEPSYFMKPPTTLNGHRGQLRRPRGARFLNYEGEVAVVIGRAMHGVPEADVLGYVAGYACANDVGLHDFRHADRGSMLRVKGQDGFCPIGPELVPADQFDPTAFEIRTYLNGEVAQQGSAADLIWPISYLLADLCRLITLEPGDVVLSGTPAHSRPMEPGDVVEVEVTGLGRLSNTVVDWDVDLSGPGDQLQVSANTLHVALAMPEDEAERAVQEGVTRIMIEIRRIDHVALRVANLDEAEHRWAIQFGLTEVERVGHHAFLRCAYEPYSLELVGAGAPGHDHTGWELRRSCTLDHAAAQLDHHGVAYEHHDGALHFADPDGYGIELMPFREEDDRRPPVARSTETLPGLHPRKLGHVNVLTTDLDRATSFYTDVLGMRISDRLLGAGNWLSINSDHHSMALVQHDFAHFHHLAFEYVDWGELRVLFDHLGQHGRWLVWGPLRHALAQNLCGYVRIPEEQLIVECYCDMEQLEPDHQPRDWDDTPHSSNVWGILPPRSYFRFDEEAVRYERDGLLAKGEQLPPLTHQEA